MKYHSSGFGIVGFFLLVVSLSLFWIWKHDNNIPAGLLGILLVVVSVDCISFEIGRYLEYKKQNTLSSRMPLFEGVESYSDFASLPLQGKVTKVYHTKNDNQVYCWVDGIYKPLKSNDRDVQQQTLHGTSTSSTTGQ